MSLPAIVRLAHAMNRLSTYEQAFTPARYYYGYRCLLLQTALNQAGIDLDALVASYSPDITYNRVHTAREATLHSRALRKAGRRPGLILGHYRAFSEGNMAIIAIASLWSSDLMVGMEHGVRSVLYKHVQRLLSERTREELAVHAFPGIYWFKVPWDLPYADRGYRGLVSRLRPSTYYADASLSGPILSEMRNRVEPDGKLVLVNSARSMTTTRMHTERLWQHEYPFRSW